MINFKLQAENNKNKIIKRDVKKFKKYCMKEFKNNIKRGIDTTKICFYLYVSSEFQEEISKIVLAELTKKYENISFSFFYDGFMNSYKSLKMVAKDR